ncbi:antibiotic biosynthesis monooxygenase [Candidatus Protofrankia californiensis]|uniref:Antibiotic biosynthesis monooxygenase n=1 Tax=Candidatus Protofrankia californiensis TaxID=1839754 RepID=A0A1C3NXH1_9ACTN|nr:antibiotic biosynthesis monooxygenase [Candidatus Protofrankia californiensis]
MVVVTRLRVPPGDAGTFRERAERALAVLAGERGYRWARLGRAVDDPELWMITSEWDGVGAWRRALSAFDVRMELTPLMAYAVDEPGAFEVLLAHDAAGGPARRGGSDLAADAATAAPGGGPSR